MLDAMKGIANFKMGAQQAQMSPQMVMKALPQPMGGTDIEHGQSFKAQALNVPGNLLQPQVQSNTQALRLNTFA